MLKKQSHLMLAGCLMLSQVAFAEDRTVENRVSGEVSSSCIVSATSVSVGNDNIENSTFAQGNIALKCTMNTSYIIMLDLGVNNGGVQTRLLMNENGYKVGYVICQTGILDNNPTRCEPGKAWYSIYHVVSGIGSGVNQNYPTYAAVLQKFSAPGQYTDTITVTISY